MVRHGPYELIFKAPRSCFPKVSYSTVGAFALAQAAVAKLLRETTLGRSVRYFASAIPHAKSLLEFDQHERRYSPVVLKVKACAIGKVNDEGSASLRTQHFHRGKFQVGSFRAITPRTACRSVRAKIVSMEALRAGRAA